MIPVTLPTRTSEFRSFSDENVLKCVTYLHSIVSDAVDQTTAKPEHRLCEPYTLYAAKNPSVPELRVNDVAKEIRHVYVAMMRIKKASGEETPSGETLKMANDSALVRREHALCCMHLETLKAAKLQFVDVLPETHIDKSVLEPLPRSKLKSIVHLFRRLNRDGDGLLKRTDLEEAINVHTRTENLVDSILFPFILHLVPTSFPGRATCPEFIILLHKFCVMSLQEITDFCFDALAADEGSIVDDHVLDMHDLKLKYPRLATAQTDHQPSNLAFLKELNKLHQEHLRESKRLSSSRTLHEPTGPNEDTWVAQMTRKEFRQITQRSPLVLHPVLYVRTWFQNQTGGVKWWVGRSARTRALASQSQKNLQYLSSNGKVHVPPPGMRHAQAETPIGGGAKGKQKRGSKASRASKSDAAAAPPMLRHGSSGYLVLRRQSESAVSPSKRGRLLDAKAKDDASRRRSATKHRSPARRRSPAGSGDDGYASGGSVGSRSSAGRRTGAFGPRGRALSGAGSARSSMSSLGSKRGGSRRGSNSSVSSADSLGSLRSATSASRRVQARAPPVLATIDSERNLTASGAKKKKKKDGPKKYHNHKKGKKTTITGVGRSNKSSIAGSLAGAHAAHRRGSDGSGSADSGGGTRGSESSAALPPMSPAEPTLPGAVGIKSRKRTSGTGSRRSFVSMKDLQSDDDDAEFGDGGLQRHPSGSKAAFTSTISFRHK
eukprot:CAMPEP_0203808582 /NCGR_PEP_ID=MMETSP0115-20131106/1700_1 /ASSEMBLY_ACC=CAM_ASM_000227 /TAXON_ID=33651 /ORGANISM="Bicosoecid sp, Strain ms1" /LENGTH=717 /DNA_ID=CAMNT_0050717273 /DNA_START=222 /DNA_END=2375 /DNA_ORIENTATION=+